MLKTRRSLQKLFNSQRTIMEYHLQNHDNRTLKQQLWIKSTRNIDLYICIYVCLAIYDSLTINYILLIILFASSQICPLSVHNYVLNIICYTNSGISYFKSLLSDLLKYGYWGSWHCCMITNKVGGMAFLSSMSSFLKFFNQ